MSGGANLHGLAPRQPSSEVTWSDLDDPRFEPQTSRIGSSVVTTKLTGRHCLNAKVAETANHYQGFTELSTSWIP